MKKLFFTLVLMLMSASVFSQSKNGAFSLRVENHTSCRQYYTVYGGELCDCINPEQDKYHSNMIVINPGTIHFYPDTTTLGIIFPTTSPAYIYGARVGSFGCSGGGTVDQPGCMGGAFSITYADCSPCNTTTATWYPDHCEGMAKLIFTP